MNYSHIIMRAARLMKRPSVIDPPPAGCRNGAPDGLAMEQRLAAAEKGFRDCFWGFHDIREFIGERVASGEPRGGHHISGVVGPSCASRLPSEASRSSYSPEKSSKSFVAIGLRLVQ